MHRIRLKAAVGSAIVAATLALADGAAAQSTSEADLSKRLDQLAAELAKVKAELAQMQQQRAAPPVVATTPATAPVAAAPSTSVPVTTAQGAGISSEPTTVLTSYGEINYNRPTRDSRNTVADLRRFVLGYQHRFDDKTKVVTELEVEHAVSSSSDRGEVEVEQAYIERQLTSRYALRAGLFLMPAGLLNENHEPTAFYGVERNFVETAIIPSTWREGGIQIVATFDNGLTAQGGITTGFDLNKWDSASTEGAESPLGSIHQELQLANARDLSVFGALNWRGVPGLLLGGSVFTGGASQGQSVASSRVTLWDLHARYMPGRWDFSGVYARGTISNTAVFNAPLVGGHVADPAVVRRRLRADGVQGVVGRRVLARAVRTRRAIQHRAPLRRPRPRPDAGERPEPACLHRRRQLQHRLVDRSQGRPPALPRQLRREPLRPRHGLEFLACA